ncbi:MAG: 16S rRNA (uracil(1498)-N(3))-methyltransferase [Ruminococcus sp.]|nr:16S rRNA (uracil(1498)-N(3))-methyltransferase [Ruminococcus sp.]
MPRFFIDGITNEKQAFITGEDARHISRSLRMKKEDALTVSCGGIDYSCIIKNISDDLVELEVLFFDKCKSEPSIDLTLYQSVPKLDKLELIIQKSVELGVNTIVPVLTRRCVSRPTEKDFEKKLVRYRRIALEAAKQSGRGIIPQVMPIINYDEAIRQMKEHDCAMMLYEQGGVRFSEVDITKTGTVSLLIGSEGGFDESEVLKADEAGIKRIWLGDRILRCETAPLAAVSVTMFLTGNL